MPAAIITDVTREEFDALIPDMRHLDTDVLAAVGVDPRQELEDSWNAATIRKQLHHADTEKPLGIWLSMYPYLDDHTALWSFVTYNDLNSHTVAFVRKTRQVIQEMFELELPQVDRAISCIPCAFQKSIDWHTRVIKSNVIKKFDYLGHQHVLVEMRKERF